MIQFEQLRYRYPKGASLAFPDWTLQDGGQAVLVGPSGSGKTTLLSLIGGMLKPASGTLTVAGQNLGNLSASAQDQFRGRQIGLVPQQLHLVASLTVAENLQLAQYLAGVAQPQARVQQVLDRLGIGGEMKRKPGELSQGQAQRVAIARAVINQPRLLLADEPTASLDDAAADAVIALFQQEARQLGATLLIASHDSRVKSRLAQRLELRRLELQRGAV